VAARVTPNVGRNEGQYMRERNLSENELLNFTDRNESHFFDNKSISISGRKIQKIAVAFANADGGEFVVGIKDKKDESIPAKRWEDTADIESFNHVFQNIFETQPQVPHTAEFLKAPNNTFALRVYIEKSESVHRTADKSVYIRKGAQSLPIKDHNEIQSLSYAKGESSYEDTIVTSATAEDIFDTKEMSSFLAEYSPATDPIDFAINQNLIDRKTYDPKTAGILIFSDNPVPLLPRRCGIKITRYETSEAVPERTHLRDQHTIEGALYNQIHDASDIITQMMESVKIMGTKGLMDAKYPPETIWEILVNAVIHRDYSISDDIHVLIFNNRIEITSPGRLPGYVTVDNILESRFSRNSKIVRNLNKYKIPPNRDMGEGLNTAFQRMEEFQLESPRITETTNSVKVIIPHTPLASPQERVMKFLDANPKIRNRQARDITGIKSENTMKRVFYDLRDRELIEPVMSKTGNRIVAWKKKLQD
jgi:ATP-dependent DNA helicase RecG